MGEEVSAEPVAPTDGGRDLGFTESLSHSAAAATELIRWTKPLRGGSRAKDPNVMDSFGK